MSLSGRKILFVASNHTGFWGHALSLARDLHDQGCQIYVFANVEKEGEKYAKEGFHLIRWRARRASINPVLESGALWQLVRVCRELRPDLIHALSLKQAIYGGIAGRLLGIPTLGGIIGLGYVFSASSFQARALRRLLLVLLKLSQSGKANFLTVENSEDLELLVAAKAIPADRVVLIRGAGVNTERYAPRPEPEGAPIVALASRLLWYKGVGDFCSAAEILRKEGVEARFVLIGDNDPQNPSSIPTEQLWNWHHSGIVEFWGHHDDMPETLAQTHIVCLPTFYREGIPKVLLEAAAAGRPIVTTNVPGCRDIVHHNENGLLVPVRNTAALATELKRLIIDKQLRLAFGKRGRERAVSEFRSELVINETLGLYTQLLGSDPL